jgi:amidase
MGPLFGIPVLLKDNINTHDKMPTTGGSRILRNSYPTHDSWVAEKLRQAGAVILGKTNLSEWANYRASFSSSGWSGLGGQTKNPYVLDRNPCGSSSGSAVAVSANLCAVAIGTETWGSIMCPSNANGIVGIKPTVGLWSRSGIMPISYTQDTAGPMTRTVEDAAILLGVATGIDMNDKKTIKSKNKYLEDYTKYLNPNGLEGKRIGYVKTVEGKNHRVDILIKKALNDLRKNGAEIIEIDNIYNKIKNKKSPEEYSVEVMAYEFKDGLKKYFQNLGPNATVSDLGDAIKQTQLDSIEMLYFNLDRMKNSESKNDLKSKEYNESLLEMKLLTRDLGMDRVMKKYNLDAFVSPTGSPAWKTDLINGDKYYISTTVFAALSGYPNINVPMGFIDHVPVGISFYGAEWSEPTLIEIAYAYEQKTKHRKKPKYLITD